jgi:Homing endonuclease associated repeat
VHVWTESAGDARRAELRRLKAELAAARRFGGGSGSATPFASRKQLLGYISGFVCAEGSFGMSRNRPGFSVHLRQDDEPLVRLLAANTGLGNVTTHRPAAPLNPSVAWKVTARAELAELRDLLWAGDLTGRKLREMDAWGAAVDEMCRGVQSGVSPRRAVLATAAARLRDLRAYRPSEGRELLRLPGRDVRAEALAALAAWARVTPGRLPATAYMKWRREHRDAPARNTIAREFGSWHRALEAAGLSDRAAASAATVAARHSGGIEARAARRDAQREQVIAWVLRFEREHGRLPRAMEFFRWRLDSAVDAPSQRTVYHLFPGGWAEVLERVRQAAGATV